MGPYLSFLQSSPSTSSFVPSDKKLLHSLEEKNKEELEKLEAKLEDARTNLGETELSDALKAKALYLARIGEKVRLVQFCLLGGSGLLTLLL